MKPITAVNPIVSSKQVKNIFRVTLVTVEWIRGAVMLTNANESCN